MLVVKAEIWPKGNGGAAYEIARVGIANVSGLAPISDYVMTALLARDAEEYVLRSEINKHERDLGWVPLAKRALTGVHLAERLSHEVPVTDPVANILRGTLYV